MPPPPCTNPQEKKKADANPNQLTNPARHAEPNASADRDGSADQLQEMARLQRNIITDEQIDPVLRGASAALTNPDQNNTNGNDSSRTNPDPNHADRPARENHKFDNAGRKARSRAPVNTADNLALQEAARFHITGKRERTRRPPPD
jgi:hypothetical protein